MSEENVNLIRNCVLFGSLVLNFVLWTVILHYRDKWKASERTLFSEECDRRFEVKNLEKKLEEAKGDILELETSWYIEKNGPAIDRMLLDLPFLDRTDENRRKLVKQMVPFLESLPNEN